LSRDFLGLPVQDFLGEVATPEPMPGAGFCAAVTLSMAAGLVAMVASASRGEWGEAKGAAAQANTLRERVAPLAQLNVEAYASAIARLRAAEYAPDQREAEPGSDPSQDLGPLLERAAQIPLEIAQAAVDVASLAAVVAERGEQALRADAVAGALLAQGAARAATTLVEVNLGTTSSDPRVTRARDLAGSAGVAAERALATLA
jgi:formiminotetrahydrofolate cyclodeaminase